MNKIRICIVAGACGLIAAGILFGEHLDVFRKAVVACLSCMGIG